MGIKKYLKIIQGEVYTARHNLVLLKALLNKKYEKLIYNDQQFWSIIRSSALTSCIIIISKILDQKKEHLNKLEKKLKEEKSLNNNEIIELESVREGILKLWKENEKNLKKYRDNLIAHLNLDMYESNISIHTDDLEKIIHDLDFFCWKIFNRVYNDMEIKYENFIIDNYHKKGYSIENSLNKLQEISKI